MSREKIVVKVDSELQDIVPGFVERRKADIPVMWDAVSKKDFNALQTFGHRLKGNAGGYGFDHLGVLGSEIENGARANDLSKIEHSIKEIEDYLARLEIIYEEVS